MINIDISIIVPSYNNKSTIMTCLRKLCEQTYKDDYEIIVIDSSTDGSASEIRSKYPQVHVIENKVRLSPGAARNEGARRSKGKYLYFIDSDCIVPENWLERGIYLFQNHKRIHGWGGKYMNGTPGDLCGTANFILEFYQWNVQNNLKANAMNLVGGACAYHRSLFKTCQFNEDFEKGQDVCFSYKAVESGYELLFDPSMKVTHLNRLGWHSFFRTQFLCGKGSSFVRIQKCGTHRWTVYVSIVMIFYPFVFVPKAWWHYCKETTHGPGKKLFIGLIAFIGNMVWVSGYMARSVEYCLGRMKKI